MNSSTLPQAEKTLCPLCPHTCLLSEGQMGLCKARECIQGVIVDQNYGRITSLALDPIEKKPLARYMPGSRILSVGSYGCNMNCSFCQNASIAQTCSNDVDWQYIAPSELVSIAQDLKTRDNIGIAYTYNEPLVGFEYVRDTAELAHNAELKNVIVSNGLINQAPLQELLRLIDAANIDLKTFDSTTYKSMGGNLECVMNTIETLTKAPNVHLEVTTLIVPGISDDSLQMKDICTWLASLDPTIPYHITRFFPCHKMVDASPTPLDVMYDMKNIASAYLNNVFLGNC